MLGVPTHDVQASSPDYTHGYSWAVDFRHRSPDGHSPVLYSARLFVPVFVAPMMGTVQLAVAGFSYCACHHGMGHDVPCASAQNVAALCTGAVQLTKRAWALMRL